MQRITRCIIRRFNFGYDHSSAMGRTGRAIYQGLSMAIDFAALMTVSIERSIVVTFWPEKFIILLDIRGFMSTSIHLIPS